MSQLAPHLPTPDQRSYVHGPCGGGTVVSGGDFAHICDPFRPCSGTYCCTCSNFVPLEQVYWADTEECIVDYRRRLRNSTPGLVRLWRQGVGVLVGIVVGALIGLIIAMVMNLQRQERGGTIAICGVVGALVIYLAGIVVLNHRHGIDYRRMI